MPRSRAEIVGQVRHRDAITSLVGKLKLKELPVFMAACALFVGNDSGPKHIAAGLGVPTVGIHSGVVDAKEWGPDRRLRGRRRARDDLLAVLPLQGRRLPQGARLPDRPVARRRLSRVPAAPARGCAEASSEGVKG